MDSRFLGCFFFPFFFLVEREDTVEKTQNRKSLQEKQRIFLWNLSNKLKNISFT